MSNHTPEPWQLDDEPDTCTNFYSDDATGSIIGGCPEYKFAKRPIDERKANARRIVACVNACAGLDTEDLERNGVIAASSDYFSKLKWQRDELLEALEDLYKGYVFVLEAGRDRIMDLGGQCDPVDVMEIGYPRLASARAVISKAKGGAA